MRKLTNILTVAAIWGAVATLHVVNAQETTPEAPASAEILSLLLQTGPEEIEPSDFVNAAELIKWQSSKQSIRVKRAMEIAEQFLRTCAKFNGEILIPSVAGTPPIKIWCGPNY